MSSCAIGGAIVLVVTTIVVIAIAFGPDLYQMVKDRMKRKRKQSPLHKMVDD